jgi:PAS domain S-box-containing protein
VAWNLDGQTAAVEQALGAGAAQHVGWFRFSFEDQHWEWSEQVQRMHGYQPGTVTPTTELVLSHKHPDDRDQVAATIKEMISTHRPFSTRHRIIDTRGATHHVIVVGDQERDDNGEVVGTHGFYIDITPGADRSSQEAISAKVAEIAERRAAIDQTKGMLMLVYGIDDATAFELLKWLSQENNVKVRLLAQQIAKDFAAAGGITTTSRSQFDQLLLTAHQRIVDTP